MRPTSWDLHDRALYHAGLTMPVLLKNLIQLTLTPQNVSHTQFAVVTVFAFILFLGIFLFFSLINLKTIYHKNLSLSSPFFCPHFSYSSLYCLFLNQSPHILLWCFSKSKRLVIHISWVKATEFNYGSSYILCFFI
jgi:hypothetical protein